MSFSLSTDSVEWGSLGLSGIFAQKSNAFSPSFLNMIREILRFGKRAPEVLEAKNAERFEGVTLGEYLSKNRYTSFFRENYVVPMCAAIWSCTDRDAMAFPIKTLIRFWVNHHLLNVLERPLWRVVRGRSKAYVDAVVAALPEDAVQCNRRVIRLDRLDESALEEGGRVRLRFKHMRARSRVGGWRRSTASFWRVTRTKPWRFSARTRRRRARDARRRQVPAERGVPAL